ncbi:MAG: hypothetical protein A3J00_01115 [Candidatus Niyogibacteria bacterium RIFCSPLOWO2_02_FULL_45_13]|uniref:Uncharacterized protein n=1 Tax=Candidatus Niyogibacteria bacterium RIFCSPLOWO2_02_FULL_45_13 TaxID=1801725 RepID=A0A1G2EWR0_9BACT|nr:MAG: hypothetical protein A3J00_01115 [Candidatus Niyogibacteria bacterium RIFCSPLOWO2_02_FULL_45_13]
MSKRNGVYFFKPVVLCPSGQSQPAFSAKIQPLTLTAYKEGAEPCIFASESFSEANAASFV